MKYSDKVLEFSTKAHEGQVRKYGSGLPYITHPIAVAEIAIRRHLNGVDESHSRTAPWQEQLEIIRSIAYLHDVVEDTKIGYSELMEFLTELFPIGSENQEVRFIIFKSVSLLTKPTINFDLFNYLDGIKDDYYALLVKLADNEHNSSDLKDQKKLDYYKLVKYYLEH